MVWCRACSWIPRSLSNVMMDVALRPLQPTSTGRTIAFQPRFLAIDAISAYRSLFLSFAVSTASSQGTVNSIKWTTRRVLDQSTRSGLWAFNQCVMGLLAAGLNPPAFPSLRHAQTAHSWSVEEALPVPVPLLGQKVSLELRSVFWMGRHWWQFSLFQ